MNQRKSKSLRELALEVAKEKNTSKVRLVYQTLKKLYLETPRTEREVFFERT